MAKTASSASSILSSIPPLLPPTDDSDDFYTPTSAQPPLMSRDPPSIESLPAAVNASIRTQVLGSLEPNWTKFDILARLCQSVLVHHDEDVDMATGASQSVVVGDATTTITGSVEQHVDMIVQGLVAKVFDFAESGNLSRKRGLSISGGQHDEQQMPFPKHIAV
jgi:hypothetical protein